MVSKCNIYTVHLTCLVASGIIQWVYNFNQKLNMDTVKEICWYGDYRSPGDNDIKMPQFKVTARAYWFSKVFYLQNSAIDMLEWTEKRHHENNQ